jgi:hypothetical protein
MRTFLQALWVVANLAVGAPSWAADPSVEELLAATDDVGRSAKSTATLEMFVKTDRYERTIKMSSWAEGTEKTLVRILEPAKDAGIATLKVDQNLWNYLPKVDRTMKVPAGMMGGSWMGSHVSNDDLVRESRLSEDYTAKIIGRPTDPAGVWVVELVPRPTAPVVWGKVVATVRPDKLPVKVEYFDEKGALVRTMTFADYQTFGTRTMPTTMTLVPADKPGEFTRLRYLDVNLDARFSPETFTLQALKAAP